MGEFWGHLLDTGGFVARGDLPGWTPGLVWLHVGSDLATWLAFLAIPFVLVYLVRAPGFTRLLVLFALVLATGAFAHLLDAVMFTHPAYRIAGLLKAAAAVVSWAGLLVLIPAVPRINAALAAGRPDADPRRPVRAAAPGWARDYIIALLAAVLAVLVRAALDRFLGGDHAFVLSLVAVVYVAWQCGFGPAVVTLLTSMAGTVYFFVEPRDSFVVDHLRDQIAVATFVLCGVACAALGQAQREARTRATTALAAALDQKAALEAEVARREAVEVVLRHREADLRANEARFRVLTEAVPQVVWNADPRGRVTYFNTRWLEYTGVSVEDAGEHGWLNAVHPDDRGPVAAAWREVVETPGGKFTHELRLRGARTGGYRWFLAAAVPLRRADGAVDQWIGSMADIDDQKRHADTLERLVRERTTDLVGANAALRAEVEERRRAEEKVQEVARELRRSNGELEQFAYVASHDLQEPLRKIQAFGDLLQRKHAAHLPAEGREYVQKMQGSAGRMRRLIDDLLTFSRVTTSARPFTPVDLNAVLAGVLDDLEVRVEQTGAAVDVGPLPEVEADPSQVGQLFQNLIGNALKFRRPGVAPAVRVRGAVATEPGANGQPAEVVRVTVEDNGIGFEEKHRERIFQVFQRLHGKDEYEGTGVGLAVCRKIAERHGGTVTAAGRPGDGSTFTVTLPLRQHPPAAAPG